MKHFYIFRILSIAFLLNVACQRSTDTKNMVGHWEVLEANIASEILDAATILNTKKRIEYSSYYFFENKEFQVDYQTIPHECYSGIWDYLPDKRELVLFHDNPDIEIEAYDILKLSNELLTIRSSEESIGEVVIQLRKYENESSLKK